MIFTPLWFWGLRRELEGQLCGTRVSGGRLSDAHLRLKCEGAGGERAVHFWLDRLFARVESQPDGGEGELPAPWEALHGSICRRIEQPQEDRRLRFWFEGGDETWRLDFYGFGLSGLALAGGAGADQVRAVLGRIPADTKVPDRPFLLALPEQLPGAAAGAEPTARFTRAVRGLDRFWVDAARRAAGIDPAQESQPAEQEAAVWRQIRQWAAAVRERAPEAFIAYRDSEPRGLTLYDFGRWLPEYRFEPVGSLSLASARFVRLTRRIGRITHERDLLLAQAQVVRARLIRRRDALTADRERQLEHRLWQENADWLTAHLSSVRQGEPELIVITAGGSRRVPLDPAVKPARQAERWYQMARRLKRGLQASERHLKATEAELERLDRLLAAAGALGDRGAGEADAIFTALAAVVPAALPRKARDRKERLLPFLRFRSPGGLAIWVGRNNRENDELTLHHAHRRDLWFHAQQTPGSHVVLRSHALRQAPPRADLLAAAATAAFFSRARHSAAVPVIYTEARYVRKPRNAPPGQVRVEREKSVMVKPRRLEEWDASHAAA